MGLGEVSPIALVEGKLQAEVGKFLMMKAVLVKLQSDVSFDIRKDANLLLQNQYQLEKDLQTGMNIITAMKTGSYTISDIATVGNIAYEIANHTKKVQALQTKAQKGTVIGAPTGPSSMWLYAAAGIGALGLYYAFGRK